jgi:signal peptidase I
MNLTVPSVFGWMRARVPLVATLVLVLAFRTVAAEPFIVPTGSMVPTIMVGDDVVASKFAYGWGKFSSPIGLMPDFSGRVMNRVPARGDVIVFRLPANVSVTYVKRVIGLPGDRIRLADGRLYINGSLVLSRSAGDTMADYHGEQRSFTTYVETLPGGREHLIQKLPGRQPFDDMAEITVPPHHYFMMGDNRDDSADSRVPESEGGVGFVPEENLIGRADFVLYSRDLDVPLWDIGHLASAFRVDRTLAKIN